MKQQKSKIFWKILKIYLAPTGWQNSSFGTCLETNTTKKIEYLDTEAEKLKKKKKKRKKERTEGS